MAIDFSRALDLGLKIPTYQREHVKNLLTKALARVDRKDDTNGALFRAACATGKSRVKLGRFFGKTGYSVGSTVYPLTNVEPLSLLFDTPDRFTYVMLVEFDGDNYVLYLKMTQRGAASGPWRVTGVKRLGSLPRKVTDFYARTRSSVAPIAAVYTDGPSDQSASLSLDTEGEYGLSPLK